VSRKHWEKLARELLLRPDALLDRIRGMMDAIPDVVSDVRVHCQREGLSHPLIETLAAETTARARECGRSF
jgi:hypothetical protein